MAKTFVAKGVVIVDGKFTKVSVTDIKKWYRDLMRYDAAIRKLIAAGKLPNGKQLKLPKPPPGPSRRGRSSDLPIW